MISVILSALGSWRPKSSFLFSSAKASSTAIRSLIQSRYPIPSKAFALFAISSRVIRLFPSFHAGFARLLAVFVAVLTSFKGVCYLDWTLVINVIGVLGFLFSLINFAMILWDRRVALSVSDADAYAVSMRGVAHDLVFVVCTICNHSAAPITVVGGTLGVCRCTMPLTLDRTLIFGRDDGGVVVDSLRSTQFPIVIPSKEAKRCILLSRCQKTHTPLLSPLQPVSLSSLFSTQFQPDYFEPEPPSVLVSIHLSTTGRKDRKVTLRCKGSQGDIWALYAKVRVSGGGISA